MDFHKGSGRFLLLETYVHFLLVGRKGIGMIIFTNESRDKTCLISQDALPFQSTILMFLEVMNNSSEGVGIEQLTPEDLCSEDFLKHKNRERQDDFLK